MKTGGYLGMVDLRRKMQRSRNLSLVTKTEGYGFRVLRGENRNGFGFCASLTILPSFSNNSLLPGTRADVWITGHCKHVTFSDLGYNN